MYTLRHQIEELLPDITESFLSHIALNPNISHMLTPLKDVEQLITQSIYYHFEANEDVAPELDHHFVTLGEQFYEDSIPISLALDFADYTQKNLFQNLMKKNLSSKEYEKIQYLFDNLTNYISKGYLIQSASEQEDLNLYLISTFKTTKYYTSLISWLNSISDAIIANDISTLPNLNPYVSELGLLMHQQQIRLILGEDPDDTDLMIQFYAIYNTANLMAYYFKEQNFRQLFMLYQDLNEKANTFQRKLSESLALYSENVEYRFNTYINRYLNDQKHLNVIILNVNNINSINTIFDKDAGDRILDTIQMIVDRFIANSDFNAVYVRTLSNEFRIAIVDLPLELANRLSSSLKSKLMNLTITHDNNDLPFYLSFASAYFDPKYTYPKTDMEKLYTYLVERARISKTNESFLSGENVYAAIDQITSNNDKVIQLRNIFRDNTITPVFQPIVRLSDRSITSFEALARFSDETGTHSIGGYIDLLVELDSIIELDIMMLNGIVENIAEIKKYTNSIFINTNPKSFKSALFIDKIQECNQKIKLHNIEPVFEITEQAILENLDAIESLYSSQQLSFALDDFGSGFSSMQMVVKLSEYGLLKYLKIDGSLIKDVVKSEKSAMVVDSIRHMACNLGIQTIAEYIEDEPILEQARSLGINYGQGFQISKPLPLDELQNFISQYPYP